MAEHPPHEPSDDENRPGQPNPFAGTPFEQMFAGLAGGDMAGLQAMFGQLQRMFAPHEGAVNWQFAHDLARQVVAQEPDRSPDAGDLGRVRDAARLAEHWLDGVTDLPTSSTTIVAWSRADWVEASMPAWQRLVEPVAESVVAAMAAALPSQAQMAGPMLGMLNQLGGAMFSHQIGQAVGGLAGEVVSGTDIGIPVSGDNTPAIVVSNAAAFGQGLGVDDSDVLLYLVLRECAHQRLFNSATWLKDYLFDSIAEYGRGITIDTSGIESKLSQLDPTNMESMQEALNSDLFDLEPSPSQRAALTRLETALALVEGWVDEVVSEATMPVMAQATALREAVRRRRAAGGPAESTFAALVGLELRPRRLRDAAALWGALRAAEGAAARDAVWSHPQLLPNAADLDDPLGFTQRAKEADELDVDSPEFDAALSAMLDAASGKQSDPPPGRDATSHDGHDVAPDIAHDGDPDDTPDDDSDDRTT